MSVTTPMPDFHQSVCGIVFFGAPHRGLNNLALVNILANKLPAELARDLYPGSSLLVSLNQSFPYTCEDITVVSCYETHATKQVGLVDSSDPESSWERTGLPGFSVRRDSACLNWPNEHRVAVHADHSKIAKLTNSPGSAYHQIKDEIKCLAEHAPAVMERRRDAALSEQEVLDLLFMLQYEFSWLKVWGTLVVQQGPAADDPMDPPSNTNPLDVIPSVPYGHPAYNIVSEISLLAESLNILLEPHRDRMTALTDETGHGTKTLGTPASASPMPKFTLFNPKQREGDENHLGAYQENTYNIDDWNSTDRAQFRLLMRKFRQANNKLLQLSPLSQSLDLIASSDVLDQLPGDSANLRHMEESMQPSDLYASLSKRASLKRQYNDPDVLNTAAALLKPINAIDMKGHAISFTRRILTTFRDKSDLGQQGIFRLAIPLASKLANIIFQSAAPTWVLVEWRYYDRANTAGKQQQAKGQAFKLARDLSISNKPPLLRTLHCIGLVEDNERKRFGFLFKIPPRSDMRTGPLSLHSYLQRPNVAGKPCPLPTLSQRFRLALSLALSMWELHACGWLHKSFHSGNILFFPMRITNDILISDPFIGGFEVGRPDSDGQLSLDVEGSGFDIYKHPELRDPSNQLQRRPAFGRKHDVYSLGLLLFEIGFWSPLRSFFKEANTPFQTTERLMRIARENLPHQMGDLYTEAVLDCLDCVVPRLGTDTSTPMANRSMTDIDDDYTRGGSSSRKFVEKVIHRLEKCHCQE
jgi:hypothetical protein